MIIIPEIETVVILVPRTGSGSLKRAIARAYPKSMLIYRHMEADGIPHGYDRWRRVGVVRDPVDRLWSLYKFLKNFSGDYDAAYINDMRNSVQMGFSQWLVKNETVFTSPYDRAKMGRFFPQYTVNHALPENWKSQFIYLRPDLGTEIWQFRDLAALFKNLDCSNTFDHINQTSYSPKPGLSEEAADFVSKVFEWDFKKTGAVTT